MTFSRPENVNIIMKSKNKSCCECKKFLVKQYFIKNRIKIFKIVSKQRLKNGWYRRRY